MLPTSIQCSIDEITIPKGKEVNKEKVKQLADSIKEVGLLNSILITPDKHLISGIHRIEAYKLLGRKKIPARVMDLASLFKELAQVDENLVRKHLTVLEEGVLLKQRDEIMEGLGLRAKAGDNKHSKKIETVTTKKTADNVGKSERTIQRRITIVKNIHPEAIDALKHSKIANNQSALAEFSHQPATIQKAAATNMDKGMHYKRAIQTAYQAKNRRKLQAAAKGYELSRDVRLLLGDFRKVSKKIGDESVDLILTDPLYCKDALQHYTDLAKIAARVLKPSGFLVAYCGNLYLNEIIKDFEAAGLKFHWIGGIYFPHGHCKDWGRRVKSRFRPVLFFRKDGSKKRNPLFWDMFECGAEKDLHHYQQSIEPIRSWLLSLSNPNDVVLDCFVGTGTVGVAAAQEKRKFIGIDIDKKMLATAKARIIVEAKKANASEKKAA